MKIAYFSPLNPSRSGISDFSEELLPYLSKHMEIDIFHAEESIENKWIKNNLNTYNIESYDDENIRSKYDTAIFHIGNNYLFHNKIADMFMKYGGILELHDIALHHYLAADTIEKGNFKTYCNVMKYCHGNQGLKSAQKYINGSIPGLWINESMKYTVNKHYIDRAKAIIVHSDFAKQIVKGENYKAKVINIPLHTFVSQNTFSERIILRRELNIDEDLFVFGMFGNVNADKRIGSILKALYEVKNIYKKFVLYIVGDIKGINIKKLISELNMKDNVIITGFISLDKFEKYMKICDAAFSLRYPTQGESSSTLHRLLGMGKTVFVSNIGSFKEYPDGLVCKITPGENEVIDITDKIIKLLEEKKHNLWKEDQIIAYVKRNFDIEKNAEYYSEFIDSVNKDDWIEYGTEKLLDCIMELKLVNRNYIKHISDRVFE